MAGNKVFPRPVSVEAGEVPQDHAPSQISAQIDNIARGLQRLSDTAERFERILEPIMRSDAPTPAGEKSPPKCTLAPLADTLRCFSDIAETTWLRLENMHQRIEL